MRIGCKTIIAIAIFLCVNEMLFNPSLIVEPHRITYVPFSKEDIEENNLTAGSYQAELVFEVRKRDNIVPVKNIDYEIFVKYGPERHFLNSWLNRSKIDDTIPDMVWFQKEKYKVTLLFPAKANVKKQIEDGDASLEIIVRESYRTWIGIRKIVHLEKYRYIRGAQKYESHFYQEL